MELTQQLINNTNKHKDQLLLWFKPGHEVDDLLILHQQGHIDLGVMIENERQNA